MALEVANEILRQLGGNRFRACTGAKTFTGSENGLTFKLPARFAKDGINCVLIVLGASDTYTMTFYKTRGLNVKTIATIANVYTDSLRKVFEMHTGLVTSLGTMTGGA